MIDVKKLKGDQVVYLASERLLEPKDGLPYLVLPLTVTKWFASANAPTFYGTCAMRDVPAGPWQATEGYLTEAEALTAGLKLASKRVEDINREALQRTVAITRLINDHAPAILASVRAGV